EHGDDEGGQGRRGDVDAGRARSREELRGVRGGQGRGLRGLCGRVFRVSRSQRGRQDLDDEDDLRRGRSDGRRALGGGPRRYPPREGGQAAHRGGAAGEQPRRGPQGQGEPARLRSLLRPAAQGRAAEGGRAARVRAAHGEGRGEGRGALRGDEAAAPHRARPRQRPRPRRARRADHGPRPPGPPPRLGQAARAGQGRQDPDPDDPLHGGGRQALRPARHHGGRGHHRRGVPGRARARVRKPAGLGVPLRRGLPRGAASRPRRRGRQRRGGRERRGARRVHPRRPRGNGARSPVRDQGREHRPPRVGARGRVHAPDGQEVGGL
ncbi:MAG: Efflux ABC transporter, ATP-binding protein, partial [uncultured Rubrobacteraceae bacterium]